MKCVAKSGPETGGLNDPRVKDWRKSRIPGDDPGLLVTANEFQCGVLDPFPGEVNPFQYDAYHMGTYLTYEGIDTPWMTLMFADRFGEYEYVIFIDYKTGMRLRVNFPKAHIPLKVDEPKPEFFLLGGYTVRSLAYKASKMDATNTHRQAFIKLPMREPNNVYTRESIWTPKVFLTTPRQAAFGKTMRLLDPKTRSILEIAAP